MNAWVLDALNVNQAPEQIFNKVLTLQVVH